MPFLDPSDPIRSGMLPASLGLLPLGITSFVQAFVLVEIAALVVPRWRRLRCGDPAGRARLVHASLAVGVGLVVVQALGVMLWMRDAGVLRDADAFGALVVLVTLVTGSCLLVSLARLVDERGLGSGFALLLAADPVISIVESDYFEDVAFLALGAAAFAVVLTLHRRVTTYRQPVGGIVPFVQAATLLAVPTILSDFLGLAVLPPLPAHFGGLVVVALALVFAFLFHPTRRIAALGARAGAETDATALRRVLLREGVLVAALLGAIALAKDLLGQAGYGVDVVAGAWLAAVVVDVASEWHARTRGRDFVAVWRLDRPWEIALAQRVLDRARIPVVVSGAHARALLHFFGPHVPIVLHAPAARAEEANGLLRALFLADDAQAGGAVESSR